MSNVEQDRSADFCYRHPDRRSFVLCQRCHQTICTECQVVAPVGVHCVECVRKAQKQAKKGRPGAGTKVARWFALSDFPVTMVLIVLMVIIWLLQQASGDVTSALLYSPAYTHAAMAPLFGFEPWRMLTSVFAHGGIAHLLLNMLSLYFIGSNLEMILGRGRFLTLFLISGFGGSVGVLVLSEITSAVVGASGAIFGLLGAYAVMAKIMTGKINRLFLGLIIINLLYGFMMSGISWQAHIGGVITGVLVGLVYMKIGRQKTRGMEILGLVGVVVLLLAISVYFSYQLPLALFQ